MSDLLNKASLVMVPSGYKEDTVYSVVPTDGSGDLSFTRASNGTRINSSGLVEVVPWNYFENSNLFTSWVKSGSSVTLTSGQTDPNGGTNAFLYARTLAYDYLLSYVSIDKYTVYCTVKKATSNFFRIAGTVGGDAVFNVNTGVVVSSSGSVTATIESLGNGWYKCVAYFDQNNGGFYLQNFPVANPDNGSGSVYIYQAQANIGSTAKPYFPTTDRLNVPRLTYQNGGGGCPSLLLEKQSTNLVVQSNDMTTWTNGAGTMTKNATTSPDGTNNALSFDNTTDCSTFVTASNGVYSWSLYVKQGTSAAAAIDMSDGSTGDAYASFTFSSKTFSTVSSGSWSNLSTSYIECGNGWFRITLTATKNAGSSIGHKIVAIGSGYTYVYGAQLEASSYPTSYIPTTSSSATRVADACFKNSISSLIGQSSGVVFADIVPFQFFDGSYIGISDNGLGNRQIFGFEGQSGNSGTLRFYGFYTGNYGTLYAGQRYKIAMAYANNDFVIYVNGTQVVNQTSGTVAGTLSHFGFDSYISSSQNFQGQVNQAILFPTRLTNAELQAITTI